MKRLFPIAVVLLLFAGCGSIQLADSTPEPSIAHRWANALNDCNVDTLVGLYHTEALLWPTTSRSLAARPEDTRRYYDAACKLAKASGFKAEIASQSVRVHGGTVVSAGEVKSSFRNREGQIQTASGRFSFASRKIDGNWMIIEHHSSIMPAAPSR